MSDEPEITILVMDEFGAICTEYKMDRVGALDFLVEPNRLVQYHLMRDITSQIMDFSKRHPFPGTKIPKKGKTSKRRVGLPGCYCHDEN